jgi:hypothetical protein
MGDGIWDLEGSRCPGVSPHVVVAGIAAAAVPVTPSPLPWSSEIWNLKISAE